MGCSKIFIILRIITFSLGTIVLLVLSVVENQIGYLIGSIVAGLVTFAMIKRYQFLQHMEEVVTKYEQIQGETTTPKQDPDTKLAMSILWGIFILGGIVILYLVLTSSIQ